MVSVGSQGFSLSDENGEMGSLEGVSFSEGRKASQSREVAAQEQLSSDRQQSLPTDFFVPRTTVSEPRLLTKMDLMWAAELSARVIEGAPVTEIIARRDDLVDFFRAVADFPMIKVFGSARDQVWTPSLDVFCDELARLSIAQGVSLGNGGGATGAMGHSIRAWERHLEREPQSTAKLVLVPLEFLQPTFEQPIQGVDALMAPGSTALQLRTTLLHAMGNSIANLYFPGGFGSAEELAIDLVGRQMARPISTVHSHRESLGKVWLVSPEFEPGDGGYWKGMFEQLTMFARSGAIGAQELDSVRVLDLKDPRADAQLVLADALRCRDSDACRL